MQQVQTGGDNLFRLAARYLGDASQWIRIAQLNDISDPWLHGQETILIPNADPTYGGGGVAAL
jgi:hypothetical protein